MRYDTTRINTQRQRPVPAAAPDTTHLPKVLIQHLHETVNELQDGQLVLKINIGPMKQM